MVLPASRTCFVLNLEHFIDPECYENLTSTLVDPKPLKNEQTLLTALNETPPHKMTLMIPGGRTYLIAATILEAMDKIRDAASKGLNFLGSCAGANLACTTLIEENHPKQGNFCAHDLNKDKTVWYSALNLLPMVAIHPAISNKQEWQLTPALLSEETSQEENKSSKVDTGFDCYYQLGSHFQSVKLYDANKLKTPDTYEKLLKSEDPFHSQQIKTEAYYQGPDKMKAGLSCTYGEGRVFITSLHPEKPIQNEKLESKILREEFLRRMFTYVGASTNLNKAP